MRRFPDKQFAAASGRGFCRRTSKADIETGADPPDVMAGFVGHEAAFLVDVGIDDRHDAGDGRGINMEGTGDAAAFHQRQHDVLIRRIHPLVGAGPK